MGLSERLADYVRGYVVIRAVGERLPAFLNLASRGGVELRQVSRPGPHALVARVRASQYRHLRHPARRAGVRLRLVRRRGLPFVLGRLAHRPGLVAGVAVALAIMGVLHSRIWAVEVAGVAGEQAQRVRSTLVALGLRPGAARAAVDPRRLEQGLMEAVPELAWVDVRIQGSLVRVEARTRRDDQRLALLPGDVVAASDGLVVQVMAASGWPVVRPGDVVRRGQVLISGRPPLGAPPDARSVRAAGVVYARVWAEGFAETGLELTVERPSGRQARGLLVTAGPWQIGLGAVEPPFVRFRTEVRHRRLPGPLAALPLRWDHVTHRELALERFAVDLEQARRLVEERALEQAASHLGPTPEVLTQRLSTWEEPTGDGQALVRSRAVIEAIQDISAFTPHEEASPDPPDA